MHLMCLAQASGVEGVEGEPFWVQITYVVIMALVTLFVLPWLKRQAERARAEAEASNQTARDMLLTRVKEMASQEAAVIAEQRFPVLAKLIIDSRKTGKLGVEQIKSEMKSWGLGLKNTLVQFFAREGTDLVVEVGDQALDGIVRWAADRTSPFPGKDTAVTLMIDDWTDRLAKFGIEWVRDHWLKQEVSGVK